VKGESVRILEKGHIGFSDATGLIIFNDVNGGKKKMRRLWWVLPGVLRQHDYMGNLPLILHMLRGKQPLKIT
jgi:hypothetical protein